MKILPHWKDGACGKQAPPPSAEGFPGGSDSKESAYSAGDSGLIPGSGRPLEKGTATHPVLLPREFHGQESLVGYRPRGCKESDMTE